MQKEVTVIISRKITIYYDSDDGLKRGLESIHEDSDCQATVGMDFTWERSSEDKTVGVK